MKSVEVHAQARLHFGFLDPSGRGERRFGGIGLAIAAPRFVLRLEPARGLEVSGEQEDRVTLLAERFFDALDLAPAARIRIVEAIPGHVGLGSGTQLALAVAAGLSRLLGIDLPPARLCALMGRARRSGVGYHVFQRGGFVVEGGHPPERATPPPGEAPAAHAAGHRSEGDAPPLLLRHDVPATWRIVLAVPSVAQTVSGEAEEAAFARMSPPPQGTVDRITHLVLLGILPALAERDLPRFGAAVAEVQELVGACFASVQDGLFHPAGAGLVRRLKEAGACGVGQSSWGPAVYAFAEDEAEEKRLCAIIREVAPDAALLVTRGCNHGAAITSG
jgi:beta-RFAP synthase